MLGGIWEIAFCRAGLPGRQGWSRRPGEASWGADARAARPARRGTALAGWASAWRMLEDMVLQRARVIAVLEAAGHATRGDYLPVYSGRGAGLRSGIAAALRAGGLEAHELDNRIYVPLEA